ASAHPARTVLIFIVSLLGKVSSHRVGSFGDTRHIRMSTGSGCRRASAAGVLAWLLAAVVLTPPAAVAAEGPPDDESRRGAPYAATPAAIVTEMLKVANGGTRDYVIDLGSGDGRLVISAVRDFGAHGGLGVDINDKLVAYASASAAQ